MASTYTDQHARSNAWGLNSPMWENMPALAVDSFRPRSSRRPQVAARIAYDAASTPPHANAIA